MRFWGLNGKVCKVMMSHFGSIKYLLISIHYLFAFIYLIDWAWGPYGEILVKFSFYVFMDQATSEVHTHVKREGDQYSPIWTKCQVNKWFIIGYKLVLTLSLFDYKSKQSQEETTAVQCTRKQTTCGNFDWLTFSQTKIWLDGKLTSENQFKKSKWAYGYFTQRIRKFEWKGY